MLFAGAALLLASVMHGWRGPHPWSHLMLSASFSTVHFSPTPHSMASSSSSWKDSSVSMGNTSLKPSLHAQHNAQHSLQSLHIERGALN